MSTIAELRQPPSPLLIFICFVLLYKAMWTEDLMIERAPSRLCDAASARPRASCLQLLFVSSFFHKSISEINKQFYRTVLTPWWGGVGSAIDVTGLQGS